MKKSALIIFLSLVLVSCTTHLPQKPLGITMNPMLSPVTSEPVLMPPKIKTIDWQVSLSPMVHQMLAMKGIKDGSILLVNAMKNNTNGSIQTGKATAVLTSLIADCGGKFQPVGADTLNAARQNLSLSADDSLASCSKAIGLARYLKAKYVLYSAASGDVKVPALDLQLISVRTGEIIWSGNGIAQN